MKKTERNYMILLTLFVISIVIANVVGARTITTGLSIGSIPLQTSGGAITYAVTFLCTDIIGEIWGKQKAKQTVFYGFIGQVFALVMIVLTGMCKAADATMDAAYQTLLGQSWSFVLGSLCAYYASQSWDVFVFHKLRDKFAGKNYTGAKRWIWNNGSTLTSQIFDTVIYSTISFGIGLGWLWNAETRVSLLGLMIGQYLLKACLALIDTPFFYFFTRRDKYAIGGKRYGDTEIQN
ncbi:MAG: queuosine precursor transporter [Oscillospiraceae bacterium]|nr:queuosine precursor transporter [Oscillospiraceae bacterium]